MANLIRENGGECLAVRGRCARFAAVENAISETVKQFGKIDIVITARREIFYAKPKNFRQLFRNGR
jgi:hypothetical protein